MFEDTICALATPHGVSGLAVVRVSGKNAICAVDEYFIGKSKLKNCASHTIHYGKFVFEETIIDSITASVFIAPHSYTGEDTIEIGLHGNTLIAQQIVDILQNKGVRAATAGEFTKRAYLNGKIDITQVEAIADLLHSQTIPGTRLAAQQLYGGLTNAMKSLKEQLLSICALLEIELDFSEEDLEFAQRNDIIQLLESVKKHTKDMMSSYTSAQLYRSGYYIGLIGYPNSGKSSLFNSLLGKNRAIVSSVEGTTRDFLEESLFINGFKVTIADTAGIRETDDIIEIEGIKFAHNIITMSDILFLINDVSLGDNHSNDLLKSLTMKFPDKEIILIQNKSDLVNHREFSEITISAKHQKGIDILKDFISNKIASISDYGNDYMINSRHYSYCQLIINDIESAISAIKNHVTTELVTIDIRSAITHIGSLLGESQEDEVLNTIFSRFCIGK
jgi:tRNA modification GTPase